MYIVIDTWKDVFNMIINDYKLLDQLWMENYELSEYGELDLSNQHILDELATIKKINISFNSKDDLSNFEKIISQLFI